MKDKSPAFQWYPKQLLGDDKVLAMDWDARGMHCWLLNLSWQQEPPGSIPDDIGVIRRWLGLPSGSDADRVWARVWPQISAAWVLEDGRRFNAGMVRAWERQQIYKQNGSKTKAKSRVKPEQLAEDEDKEFIQKSRSKPKEEFTGDDLAHKLLFELGIVRPNGELPQVVSAALEWKSKQLGWTMEKAFLHILERGKAYISTGFRRNWTDWFGGRFYDQEQENWEMKGPPKQKAAATTADATAEIEERRKRREQNNGKQD